MNADPLGRDELEAIREATERLQDKAAWSNSVVKRLLATVDYLLERIAADKKPRSAH
jgi:hypothetical protein